jgi:DNA-binding PadR family transcriptional regulator
MRGASTPHLTELEANTLSEIWRHQPCSAYLVQREFAKSLTPEWSGSAGAIYPVTARLRRYGLVEARTEPWGKKGKTALALTPAGEAALRQWVGQIEEVAGVTTADPTRTRMFCLDIVRERAAKVALVARAAAVAEARLGEVREAIAARQSAPFVEQLAAAGTVAAMEARVAWLKHVLEQLRESGR